MIDATAKPGVIVKMTIAAMIAMQTRRAARRVSHGESLVDPAAQMPEDREGRPQPARHPDRSGASAQGSDRRRRDDLGRGRGLGERVEAGLAAP